MISRTNVNSKLSRIDAFVQCVHSVNLLERQIQIRCVYCLCVSSQFMSFEFRECYATNARSCQLYCVWTLERAHAECHINKQITFNMQTNRIVDAFWLSSTRMKTCRIWPDGWMTAMQTNNVYATKMLLLPIGGLFDGIRMEFVVIVSDILLNVTEIAFGYNDLAKRNWRYRRWRVSLLSYGAFTNQLFVAHNTIQYYAYCTLMDPNRYIEKSSKIPPFYWENSCLKHTLYGSIDLELIMDDYSGHFLCVVLV